MLVNEFTRKALAYRKENKKMTELGYERVGEDGGLLWQLHRGYRINHKIIYVKISVDGKSLWIRTSIDASC